MEEILINIENIKDYINNIQNEDNLTLYKMGYRMGIVMVELDTLQQKLEAFALNTLQPPESKANQNTVNNG